MNRISLGFVALALLAVVGCPATADDLCAKGTCDPVTSPASSTPQDGGSGIVEAPRDNCVDKPLSPECADDASALFVSKTADPATADGTVAHPYASIRTALEKATDAKKRVYVCEGTYEEQVSIEKVPVTLIGGIACDFRSPGGKPKIAPPSGIALSIAAVGGASVLDVAVQGSSEPSTKGASAIGMFVTTAKNVLLRRVDVVAGRAQNGTEGPAGTQNWSGDAVPANANSGMSGGPAPACGKCADGATSSSAGQGGNANGSFPGDGSAVPKVGTSNAGVNKPSPDPGKSGANGEARPAAKGAARPGVLMATSWNTEATSQPGPIGNPGQGGGGGGASQTVGGGSGGCGGCGGGGGGNGGNGGSSVALLVFESEITIEESTLTASEGGDGGPGAPGLDGQAPSFGGSGVAGGGTGGYGAGGGGGGGGAGGHSAAIAHVGAAPATDEKTVLKKSTAGAAGKGGDPGKPADPSGNEGNAGEGGAPGAATEVLALE